MRTAPPLFFFVETFIVLNSQNIPDGGVAWFVLKPDENKSDWIGVAVVENKEKYLENGSFYIFNPEKFLKKKCRLFGKIGCFTMNKVYSFQIDDYQDIELFKNLRRYF